MHRCILNGLKEKTMIEGPEFVTWQERQRREGRNLLVAGIVTDILCFYAASFEPIFAIPAIGIALVLLGKLVKP
jgi:hypothetical protein